MLFCVTAGLGLPVRGRPRAWAAIGRVDGLIPHANVLPVGSIVEFSWSSNWITAPWLPLASLTGEVAVLKSLRRRSTEPEGALPASVAWRAVLAVFSSARK